MARWWHDVGGVQRAGGRRWAGLGVAWALAATALVGCESVPAGNPLQPVAVQAPAARPVAAPAPKAPADATAADEPSGFDFAGEDRADDGRRRDLDTVELQARLLGVDPAFLPAPTPPAEPAAPVAAAPAPVEIPVWDHTQALPDGSFGVRLLATLVDVQPPRAVLGLPDGSERVVQAGAILQEHKLVVMAIGRDVVQIARVVPQGFYARVDTQTVQSLFPSQRQPSVQ